MTNDLNKDTRFDDLTDALNYVHRQGYNNEFNIHEGLVAHSSKKENYKADEIKLRGFVQYNDGEGNINNIYKLETNQDVKGYLIGESNSARGKIIDEFIKSLGVKSDNGNYDLHEINNK